MSRRKRKTPRILGLPGDEGACAWYRVEQPLEALERAGLAETYIPPMENEQRIVNINMDGRKDPDNPHLVNNYDMLVFQRQPTGDVRRLIDMSHQVGIPVVFDIDDGALSITATNPNYMSWGRDKRRIKQMVRNFKAAAGERGNVPKAIRNKTPEQVAEEAQQNRLGILNNIRVADMVTVTTPALKREYSSYSKNIVVLPNQMNREVWEGAGDDKIEHPDELWIGWEGGWTHLDDLKILRSPLQTILSQYPHVRFVLIGFVQAKSWVFKNLPQDRIIPFPWSQNLSDYRKYIASLDIVVAPSHACRFNEGKSDIRAMEAWLCKLPVIGSPTTYGESIKKAEGGLVANKPKDWLRAFRTLIDKPALRRAMGESGYNYVVNGRTYDANVHLWNQAYRRMLNVYQSRDT